jgi:hypothetical protein
MMCGLLPIIVQSVVLTQLVGEYCKYQSHLSFPAFSYKALLDVSVLLVEGF